jgi:uncharacterized membrane protein
MGGTPTVTAAWSGPLTPPSVLKDFDDVVPNGAARIFAAWESETEHRHGMERRNLMLAAADAIIGKVFAFIFVITALSACIYMATVGQEWVAAVLGGGTIASVVWAFVRTNRSS